MKFERLLSVAFTATMLSACGGGGGGVGSTPPPPMATPTPTPTPTNSSVANLVADETFATLTSSSDISLALADAEVGATSVQGRTVTISYDADADSFTVSQGGHSSTFTDADIIETDAYPGTTRFLTQNGDTSEFLTISTRGYSQSSGNQYVALGYWQRNVLNGGQQETEFDTFLYGFPTATGAVPITGFGSYNIDIFGAFSVAGTEARALSGGGLLELDFQTGAWRVRTTLGEYPLTSFNYISGGTLKFNADGLLTSDRGLAGVFTYSNQENDQVSGQVAGRFYGPSAEEVGAVFSGDNGTGGVLNGAFTGKRDNSSQAGSLALTNLNGETIVSGYLSEALGTIQDNLTPAFRGFLGNTLADRYYTQVQFLENGTVNVFLGDTLRAQLLPDQLVPGEANFDTYATTAVASDPADEVPMTVKLFKPGADNSAIALTYASFGIIEQDTSSPNYSQQARWFFTYGFDTPPGHLNLRSGTASYSGIARGVTTNASGTVIDVDGSSLFVVDFGSDTYSGELDLQAHDGGNVSDLGVFGFASTISNGQLDPANFDYPTQLSDSQQSLNRILPVFYGPNGSEIVAPFSILVGEPNAIGSTTISGVAAAREE